MRHRKVLIVQFDVREGDTLEWFHHIEDTLFQAFSQNRFAEVDGHDYGQGKFNIFIYPKGAWAPVLERVHAFLKLRKVHDRTVIAKGLESGRWQVVWPENYSTTFEF
ncbi:hypothetical protein [Sphingopyxis sp.]|jgi:hypothetical protein|uniref:hypothetical protein n=1 Tax=Sphingopyxis sp. TaxID=1908224 RepID=UPI002DF0BA8A|nr:hypothetical protein [Sphingopyxis sp.]